MLEATDPALAAHAVSDPGPARFGGVVEDPDRLLVLEAVYEGYLMHYGTPRAFTGMDPDLRLLAGDSLYASALSRLADSGDLGAVTELADLISLSARAHAAGRLDVVEEMWLASAHALSSQGGPGARVIARDRLSTAP
jgi:hypothetical protein